MSFIPEPGAETEYQRPDITDVAVAESDDGVLVSWTYPDVDSTSPPTESPSNGFDIQFTGVNGEWITATYHADSAPGFQTVTGTEREFGTMPEGVVGNYAVLFTDRPTGRRWRVRANYQTAPDGAWSDEAVAPPPPPPPGVLVENTTDQPVSFSAAGMQEWKAEVLADDDAVVSAQSGASVTHISPGQRVRLAFDVPPATFLVVS